MWEKQDRPLKEATNLSQHNAEGRAKDLKENGLKYNK